MLAGNDHLKMVISYTFCQSCESFQNLSELLAEHSFGFEIVL